MVAGGGVCGRNHNADFLQIQHHEPQVTVYVLSHRLCLGEPAPTCGPDVA